VTWTTGSIACRVRRLAVAALTLTAGPPEAIVQTSDHHYQVMLEGQWVDVPDEAVLDVPNKYGKALVWYSKSWRSKVTGQEGDFYIRCFLPGELY